jgi:hypothetical protein
MQNLHLKKCKNEGGWELTNKTKRVLWAARKKMLVRCLHAVGTIDTPVSVKIHGIDGKFEEERTYPRSADPRKSKG